MGRSADERWLQIIIDEMTNSNVEMRTEAARAAGIIGHELAVRELAALLFDEDLAVRLTAVDSLGLIGGSKATMILQGVLADLEAEEIHDAVLEALEQIEWLGSEIDLSILDWDSLDDDLILSA
jgi:HEAT repeat protein